DSNRAASVSKGNQVRRVINRRYPSLRLSPRSMRHSRANFFNISPLTDNHSRTFRELRPVAPANPTAEVFGATYPIVTGCGARESMRVLAPHPVVVSMFV